MKKIIRIIAPVLMFIAIVTINEDGIAETNAPGEECKWLEVDCPGWFSGSYEACLVTGDGTVCTCGTVSRKCDAS